MHDQVDVSSAREGIPTVAYLAHAYGTVATGSPDWIFVEVAGAEVGYAHTSWWTETGPLEVYLERGWVVPRWRGARLMLADYRALLERVAPLVAQAGLAPQTQWAQWLVQARHETLTGTTQVELTAAYGHR